MTRLPPRPTGEILRSQLLPAYGLDPSNTQTQELRVGHINDSFRVTTASCDLLVQRINSRVFRDPPGLMANVVRVTDHLQAKLDPHDPRAHQRCLRLHPTIDGSPYFIDHQDEVWRAYDFLSGTLTLERPRNLDMAKAAGHAYGKFQQQLSDLEPDDLCETIPRFHEPNDRFRQLDEAAAEDPVGRLDQVRAEVEAAEAQRPLAARLAELQTNGRLPRRVVHNDAKLTNVLLDEDSLETLCVIDLDTVMPGLAHFDFGDMVRSMSHTSAEDEPDSSRVRVDIPLFSALARGFIEAGTHLTSSERQHLLDGGLLAALEHVLRFLADYLDGDRYFRVTRPTQNLDRARAHLSLLESLLAHQEELREIVERLADP